ncbi:hypothetical protein ACFLTV_01965 [Chloroflexota bacterium]
MENLVEPQPDAFDYFYYQRGLEIWREEYQEMHNFTRKRSAIR